MEFASEKARGREREQGSTCDGDESAESTLPGTTPVAGAAAGFTAANLAADRTDRLVLPAASSLLRLDRPAVLPAHCSSSEV